MSNDNNYIICITIIAMSALFALLLNAFSKSNQEIKETAEEAAIIQQFEQLQYRVKCEKVENNNCLEYSVYRIFKE